MKFLKKAVWSPYIVGTNIGLITLVVFLFFRKTIGISTAFVRIYGFIVGLFSLDHISINLYLSKYMEYKPVFEWQASLLVGIIIGAWIAAKITGVTFSFIPFLWGKNFGFSKKTRALGATIGGFLVLFGARLAGGCPMGNGISEGMHLVTISWIFLPTMFLGGIVTAFILYRKK